VSIGKQGQLSVTYGRELANAMRAYGVGLCGFRWYKVVRQLCSHHAHGARLILLAMMYCFFFSCSRATKR
jgi:hypothetical protein